MPKPNRSNWIKFVTEDWLGDRELNKCSLQAQGLWINIVCLGNAHEFSDPYYGHLVKRSSSGEIVGMDARLLARELRQPVEQIEVALEELNEAGIYSLNADGIMYSRRLVRDRDAYLKVAAAGAKGGSAPKRPASATQANGKGALKLESEREKEKETEGESERGGKKNDVRQTNFDRLCKIAGIDMAKLQRHAPWMEFPGLMLGWTAAGADPDKDIWPTIEHMLTSFKASNAGAIPKTPVYFSKAITEARDARLLKAKAAGRDWNFTITKGTDKAIKLTDAVLRNAKGFWEHGHWSSELGPSPVDPNFDWPDAAKAELLALRNEPIAESEWYGSRPPGWV